MSSLATFTLDPLLFNSGLYTSVLRMWLPTYPKPSSSFTQADVTRWFSTSTTFDAECATVAGRALASIGPEKLILPSFTSLEADRALYSELSLPFLSQLESSSQTGENTTSTNSSAVSASASASASASTPYTALALSLLLDQLPRNLNRGPAQAVVYEHYDRLSLALGAHIRAQHLDRFFADAPIWQLWFYMSLEHSEVPSDHEMLHALLRGMLERARSRGDASGATFVERATGFAERHWNPLREFGRFPWRNRWLGRESTEVETRWLESGGDRFGTG